MGFFDICKQPDINKGVIDFREETHALLLDVRTPEEYKGGHIPGSKNVPLQNIDKIGSAVKSNDAVLYVYCHSGARSSQAVAYLQRMGYHNAKNIGGIATYRGKIEK